MNGITIGDIIHEDEIGHQDGDESNEENGETKFHPSSQYESNSGTITKTEF